MSVSERAAALAAADQTMHPLRRRRLVAGLSAPALAKSAGCHPQSIYHIETGDRPNPTDELLYRLALVLDCGTEDLRP